MVKAIRLGSLQDQEWARLLFMSRSSYPYWETARVRTASPSGFLVWFGRHVPGRVAGSPSERSDTESIVCLRHRLESSM